MQRFIRLNPVLKTTTMSIKAPKLDEIDFKILKVLQEEGKISNLNLSKKIGLSPAPTLERVKKLEQSGVINSYHAQLDEIALGLHLNALVQITLVRQLPDAAENFLKQAYNIPEVMEVYQVTGNYDFHLRVITKDILDFERLIREELSKIDEIANLQTMVVLRKHKASHILPLKYD
jgi:DNA-binding Lrp family transcriptional regulator